LLWWRSWSSGRLRWRLASRRDHGSEAVYSPAASARGSAGSREPRDPRRPRHPHQIDADACRGEGPAPASASLIELPSTCLQGLHTMRRSAGAVADFRQLFVVSQAALRGAVAAQKPCTKVCTELCTESADQNPPPPRHYWGFCPEPSQTTRPPRCVLRVVWLGSGFCGGQAGWGHEGGRGSYQESLEIRGWFDGLRIKISAHNDLVSARQGRWDRESRSLLGRSSRGRG